MSFAVQRLLALLSVLIDGEAYRILMAIPTPSVSHQVMVRPLYVELAKRGHQIDVITTDPMFPKGQAPPNLTEFDVHDVSYPIWRKNFWKATSTGDKTDNVHIMTVLFDELGGAFDRQLDHPDVKEKILKRDADYYDLVVTEANSKGALGFAYKFNASLVQLSTFYQFVDNFQTIGAPQHPLLYPAFHRQTLFNLTMWEKIKEVYNDYLIKKAYLKREIVDNAIMKKHFGPDCPTVEELRNKVQMLFLNTHPALEGNYPVPPNVVYMWGLYKNPQKPLPKDQKEYLDSSKNGVIYMSFGTNTAPSLLDQNQLQVFMRVFAQLPYDVFFKCDLNEIPNRPPNVKLGKWFQQPDLLRHPKVRLFITQGGLQSTDETIDAGVPMLGVPMLGDQWFNTEQYLRLKIGLKLDFPTFDEETLKNAINTLIDDESYRKNVANVRSMLEDQPEKPLDRTIWWLEYVIRHGGAMHLRSPAANMSWREYVELDLVLVILGAALTVKLIVLFAIKFLLGLLFGRSQNSSNEKRKKVKKN